MRAYRKRPWARLVVDMTPLIDVIFLIIIFFIILINFSQVHIRNVILPNADQAYVSDNRNRQQLLVT
ncbi:MAG: biopolymer transporter ExbD, partial [Gammaproteobacteria bacterium]